MGEKTHWKKLVNLDYIGAYSLNGKDLVVEITEVSVKRVKGEGGKEEECTVATLKGQKPFIINRTNAKVISKLYNSPYIEDWVGKKITLFPTTTRVAGETVECLRVRPSLPKSDEAIKKVIDSVLAVKNREELNKIWESETELQGNQDFLAAIKKMGLKYPIQ